MEKLLLYFSHRGITGSEYRKKNQRISVLYKRKFLETMLKTKQDIPREISMIYNLLRLCKVLSIPYKYLLSVNS